MTIVFGWLPALALVLGAYVIGSIPFGVLVGKFRGADPRGIGSGNIGATNVMRALGPGWAITVLLLDLAKGYLPVWGVRAWLTGVFMQMGAWGAPVYDPAEGATEIARNFVTLSPGGVNVQSEVLVIVVTILVALAAMAGHNWSIFLKGKGGKGASTGCGVVLALDWRVGLLIASVFIIVVVLTRYVSLGSTLGAWCVPLGLWWWHRGTVEMPFLLGFGLAAALLITFKHRSNYQRLLGGTEVKIGHMKRQPDPPTEVSGLGPID